MQRNVRLWRHALFAVVLVQAVPGRVDAAGDEVEALRREVESLKQQLQEIQAQLKQQASQAATKQEVQAVKQEVSQATKEATEWKHPESIVHLAGYAAVGYTDVRSDRGAFDQVTFNPIFHYQYNDLMLLQAELETSITPEGETEVNLEYGKLDLLLTDYLVLEGGKFLSPIGFFRQNLHPAWINKLPSFPPGFSEDEAAPVADVGLALRGGVPFGQARTTYDLYVANGPRLELNAAGTEIEALNTEGAASDVDSNKVVGGRLGVLPWPNLGIGLSGVTGKTRIDQAGQPTRNYNVYDVDLFYQPKAIAEGLELRGEYVKTRVGGGGTIDPESRDWEAYYLQAAYRIPGTKFEPVLRYGWYNPPGSRNRFRQWAPGIDYVFASNVMAKFAYEFNDLNDSSDNAGRDRLLLQLAYGF